MNNPATFKEFLRRSVDKPDEIDHHNLKENIEPTKDRSRLILEKGPDHSVQSVRLRKI